MKFGFEKYIMRFSIIVILLLFSTLRLAAQEKIRIIDIESKKAIAYATVAFGEGLGGFTDEEGYFTFDKKQNFTVSMLGYEALFVSEKNFKEVIELDVQPILLDEIIISNKKGKTKSIKKKAYWKNSDFFEAYNPFIANEIAVLIPNDKKQMAVVNKIIVPIAQNPYRYIKGEFVDKYKELPYTIARIRFYSNENNEPKELLYTNEIVVNIHNTENKFFEIDLEKYSIDLPENGLFVGIEFIGFADKNEKYVYRPNFAIKEKDGKEIRVSLPLIICIPVENKGKAETTFIRYANWEKNGEKNPWNTFTKDGMVRIKSEQAKKNGIMNIGLGY